MVYATEFQEVQNALGISVYSFVSEKPYAEAQRTAILDGRLEIKEKAHPVSGAKMWGAFVDGTLLVFRVDGKTIPLDDQKREKFAASL